MVSRALWSKQKFFSFLLRLLSLSNQHHEQYLQWFPCGCFRQYRHELSNPAHDQHVKRFQTHCWQLPHVESSDPRLAWWLWPRRSYRRLSHRSSGQCDHRRSDLGQSGLYPLETSRYAHLHLPHRCDFTTSAASCLSCDHRAWSLEHTGFNLCKAKLWPHQETQNSTQELEKGGQRLSIFTSKESSPDWTNLRY